MHLQRPEPRTDADVIALARWQVATANSMGDAGFGGRLLVCEATRNSITTIDHGPL
jgi:hypothetical protein